MQGSAADIVKVAMFNGHPVNTNGSNIVDSMDGLTQRNRKSEGVVTFFYRYFTTWSSLIFLDLCGYLFFKYRQVKVMSLHFVGA